ncbi:hypothetical protein HYE10_02280 [Mycoplasmopsis bovis]|nr:hypothetical protein HYE10_02280 [Mycoplasmopsis bovis]
MKMHKNNSFSKSLILFKNSMSSLSIQKELATFQSIKLDNKRFLINSIIN